MSAYAEVAAAMRENRPISGKQEEAAVEILERMRSEAEERGLKDHADRLADSIEAVRDYRKNWRKRIVKPRCLGEIQKDIDAAHSLVVSHRAGRQYEAAAKWERKRDELQREYESALTGKPCAPDVGREENGIGKRRTDGLQLSL